METRHRTAGDGNEQEREHRAFPQRPGAVDVLRDRRHFQFRVDDHDANRQAHDHADFQERREVIARCQNQPDRQQRGDKRVANQGKGNGGVFKGQRRAPVRVVRNNTAEVNGGDQQDNPNDRHFADASWTQEAHVDTHEQRNRYG